MPLTKIEEILQVMEMLQEVLKQVGGEAEYNRMNVIQRKALAESVGVNVEELSRLVRNQATGAGATGQLTQNQVSDSEYLARIAESNDSIKTSAGGFVQGIKNAIIPSDAQTGLGK